MDFDREGEETLFVFLSVSRKQTIMDKACERSAGYYSNVNNVYGVCWRTENKRERLVNNLKNLSAGDRVRMLKAIPLNMTEKSELR